MNKYTISYDCSAGPEDAEAGRDWEVVHRQAYQDGRWLHPVAGRCTKVDAQRIADCLNACEGVAAENVNVNQLILNYAELKIKYNNLRCDGLDHLRDVLNTQNCRGQYYPGGSDYNTEAGRAWREASTWLALQG